ncbi:DNA-processing protein DprA [Desulforamulus aeronauticus]|uniref:DNA processing protein n=1 Tax=Desulforamulus aeronauticus DSM 10349 TaxID=1121421 RepID=A0A1M6U5G0_9FIRM|nr:DNA-processing protein DprA [Desulforamulus aeronauticus]SHK64427.1 DNA processing protein [Desulforamulus aeronauticus DSM 10349]
MLHYLGEFPIEQKIIAIIGPRRPSCDDSSEEMQQHRRDCTMAYELARQAAKKGLVVLSGLATGIDTAAHLGCLDEGGLTIAVVPFGLAAPVYPPENLPLYTRILDGGGCIVSQFKPDQSAVKWSFVARNKTQALLAHKVLVVATFPPHGLITGGTKHCAYWARKMAKPLYHYREVAGKYLVFQNEEVFIDSFR